MSDFISVNSEVAPLERLIIHSPDSGLGKVVPSKAQDWLFEDIIHLETMRRKEYDLYVKLLLYFLDPDAIKDYKPEEDPTREFFKPNSNHYYKSDKVIDVEKLLYDILGIDDVKKKLVASITALENCSYKEMQEFLGYPNLKLSRLLLTGMMEDGTVMFPPVPNLIFTRDIGVIINDHILITKPARRARMREVLIAKYIFYNHPFFKDYADNIIEIEEDDEHFLLPEDNDQPTDTLEGGDVMMVAPNHLFIGVSERTSLSAAKQAMNKLFAKNVVEKVTIIKIPSKRDYMHIDTVFTQIKKNVWVILRSLVQKEIHKPNAQAWEELGPRKRSEKVIIKQFINKEGNVTVRDFVHMEELLTSVAREDLNCNEEMHFIYSGNDEFPYGDREQWTDSCNLLILQEGVGIAYDRNDRTDIAFRDKGFDIVKAEDLINKFETGEISPKDLKDTIIHLPSAELSRARGGTHCMSLPLKRHSIK